ncbi:MAG: hypothetical protein AABX37_06280 [Nanoarchaeota archaeon]
MTELTGKDISKLRFRVGTIRAVKKHPKTSDYIFLVDIGHMGADRQMVADLKASYSLQDLLGKQVVFLENVSPIIVAGIESYGYILVAHKQGKPILVQPEKKVSAGAEACLLSNVHVGH